MQLVPSGELLAHRTRENLWLQPLDGSAGRQLTALTSEKITDFHWAPDGSALAVIREDDIADVLPLREGNQ